MRHISIFVFISAIFTIALLATGVAFYFYGINDKYRHSQIIAQRCILFAQNILLRLDRTNADKQIEEISKKYGMKWIKDEKREASLLKGAKLLGRQPTPFGFIDILEKDNRIYLLIGVFGKLILFEDERYHPYDPKIVWVYFAFVSILIMLIFWAIWLKLKPLKSLQQCIKKFGEGELDVHCRIDGSDEIAQVSISLDEAIGRVRMLINSRNLFIRNIMHELKTPLTKGLLTVQMLSDSKQKERLERIFLRLDSTISEFGTMEQLNSGKFSLKLRAVTMEDLIDQAIDLAMIEKDRGTYDIKPQRVEADFKLLSIAIKNLIDNAIKYSSDRKFHIIANKEAIVVESSGKPLSHPLSYYTQAYTQGDEAISGLGLGLYIVDTITKTHNFNFEYEYKNNKNRFIINFCK